MLPNGNNKSANSNTNLSIATSTTGVGWQAGRSLSLARDGCLDDGFGRHGQGTHFQSFSQSEAIAQIQAICQTISNTSKD